MVTKYSERDLSQVGMDEGQLDLIRRQYTHLRAEGRSGELEALALRSRFLNADDLVEPADADNHFLDGEFTLQTILPLDLCRRYGCLPADYNAGQLTLLSSQPIAGPQLERIKLSARLPVRKVLLRPVSRHEVLQEIHKAEQSGSVAGLLNVLRSEGIEANRLKALVYAIMKEALTLRASDIHLSKKSDPDAWVAYRIDSVMRQTHLLPEVLMQALVARIKIEAGMDASNSRTAQDGRLAAEHQGRMVDFRLSTQPLVDGESVVMRALDPNQLPSLGALFPKQPRVMQLIRSITTQSGKTGGLVFISGATGSGKSTTQYTIACGFRRDTMNVITVEDPVEYLLPFAKQIQLQALIKQRAIELERSILRQDPDILIFGEIRDADSARAALAFAESGHMVISTIHANSALQVTERFLSMIDPAHRADSEFLIGHYLRLVVHQKLLKKLCSCALPCSDEELADIQFEASRTVGGLIEPRPGLRKRRGCSRCNQTGYLGRVSAHETMHIPNDQDMRGRYVRAFKAGTIELAADLCLTNGVEFISRFQTLNVLLNAGVVDWETAIQAVGVSRV